jgi:hypothetical protein
MSGVSKWQPVTRGGREVRIYAEDGALPFSIHGAIMTLDGWKQCVWTAEGYWYWRAPTLGQWEKHIDDLLPVIKRRWRTCAELVDLWQSGKIKGVEFCPSGNIYASTVAGNCHSKKAIDVWGGKSTEWLEIFTTTEQEVTDAVLQS